MMTPIGALKLADPTKWEATVRAALEKHGGRIPAAALELGVSGRQLSRWLAENPDLPRAAPGRPWPEGQKAKKAKASKKVQRNPDTNVIAKRRKKKAA